MLVLKVLQCLSVFSHKSACLAHNNSLVATHFYSPKSQNKFHTDTEGEGEIWERERGGRVLEREREAENKESMELGWEKRMKFWKEDET